MMQDTEWLDIDQMIELLRDMAKAQGRALSRDEAAAYCLHAIRKGDVQLFNAAGQPIEVPELADAHFLDDVVEDLDARHAAQPSRTDGQGDDADGGQ